MSYILSSDPLLVFIGPSGSGKTTIAKQLVNDGIVHITPTWTTRPPRISEQADEFDHVFCDDDEFDSRQRHGDFLETVSMFGLPFKYGIGKVEAHPNKVPLIMIRATLVDRLQRHYASATIYNIIASEDDIANRLRLRGEELGTRLEDVSKEIAIGRGVARRTIDCGTDMTVIRQYLKEDFDL